MDHHTVVVGMQCGSICHQCATQKNCLLGAVDTAPFNGLKCAVRHAKPLRKGRRLFFQGDPFSSLYLVRSGSFKSCITSHSGGYQITDFHFSGDVLGLDGLELERHSYEVEALETASVCTLPFDLIESVAGPQRTLLYKRLMGAVSSIAFRESELLMVLSKLHAPQRLANFLLNMSIRMGEPGRPARAFRLSMARYDIANYLGLAVETISRLFRHFQDQKLIVARQHQVELLDYSGLQQIVDGEQRFSGLRNVG